MLVSFDNSSHFFGIIEKISLSEIQLPSFILRFPGELDIKEMADSILQYGLLNPIIVRNLGDCYELVAGIRRYFASLSLGWKKIPCNIVSLNERETFEVALIENIGRKSLSPLEEGKAFKTYVSTKGWGSIAELSKKICRSSSYITKRIALLDLPKDVLSKIESNQIKPSLAEELLSIKESYKQSSLCNLVIKKQLTTNKIREIVKQDPSYHTNSKLQIKRDLCSFDKSINAVRIAMNRIDEILEGENNFLIRELLLYNRKKLHDQIDEILKSRKKYEKEYIRYRKILSS